MMFLHPLGTVQYVSVIIWNENKDLANDTQKKLHCFKSIASFQFYELFFFDI